MHRSFLHFNADVLHLGAGGHGLTLASSRGRRSASQPGLQVGATPLPLQRLRAQHLLLP